MLGIVFALPVLLIAASAIAQSPKVDEPPISSGSSTPRDDVVPVAHGPVAAEPAARGDDERRQEDARRRALLMLLLNSGGRVQPFSGMSH
jgi:hypothetical protein